MGDRGKWAITDWRLKIKRPRSNIRNPQDSSRAAFDTAAASRRLALQTLGAVERERGFADEAFARFAAAAKLSAQDQALAFELVYGVLRHRATLDWRLNAVASRPMERLPLVVANVLRLGAYQMLYLDRIPVSAAVNESVTLARRVKGRDWRGMVNGILRNLDRRREVEWPDVAHDPVEGLSVTYSCPHWLTQRWIDQWGRELAEQLCRRTLTVPPLTLRTNTLRCSREQLESTLREQGYAVSRTAISPQGLVLEHCGPLHPLSVLREGWCYVEDEAAQLVPLLLDVRPGHRVLDACAAPGGKCSHVAALMQNQGEIIATDPDLKRLKRLESNLRTLGITCAQPVRLSHDAHHPSFPPHPSPLPPGEREEEGRPLALSRWEKKEGGFDRILADVPCSGLGVLRRHPEAKWQKPDRQAHAIRPGPACAPADGHLLSGNGNPEDGAGTGIGYPTAREPWLDRHGERQFTILQRVSRYLRPNGVLVYSACSTEPEETTDVISRFCREHPDFHHEPSAPWLPPRARSLTNPAGDFLTVGSPYNMDGFFAARLRRT